MGQEEKPLSVREEREKQNEWILPCTSTLQADSPLPSVFSSSGDRCTGGPAPGLICINSWSVNGVRSDLGRTRTTTALEDEAQENLCACRLPDGAFQDFTSDIQIV